MKFCRACGTPLAVAAAQGPSAFAGMPPSGPLSTSPGGPQGGPFMGGALPPTLPPGNSIQSPVAGTPLAALAPTPMPYGVEVQATMVPGGGLSPFATPPPSSGAAQPVVRPPPAPGAGGMIACPRCGSATPANFVYCQSCGLHLQAIAPTDPNAAQALAPPPMQPPPSSLPPPPSMLQPPNQQTGQQPPLARPQPMPSPIDPQAATLAADAARAAGARSPAAPNVQLAWGTAILVNRDGSDGARYPLAAEYLVIGRTGADIAFEDDRFLAPQHARVERGPDGVVKVTPIDTLNGVFRKADAAVELTEGTTVLVGREVLRFERVDDEERTVHPLIRHGVALFGSPPREPWGRLLQILPSGGHRDIRHLVGEETVLGREEGDIIFRDDAFMSRRHAAINWDGKRGTVTDLGSSNGTFVRLVATTPLKHGDHLRLGDQLLRIELQR